MMRLSQRELPSLPRTVRRPDVDRAALHAGIVHLGLGAFARAQLAAFTQPLLAADPSRGILGVSLRSWTTRDSLAPQAFLYTCAARDGSGISLALLSVLTGILVAPESKAVVVAAMPDPAVRIVSISVSERGYHRRAADGALDEVDPHVWRRANGVPPFIVLCCDNLPDNGNSTRVLVGHLARLIDPALTDFIENEAVFPNTMVDQIVPATTDTDHPEIDAALGVHDAWPVVCEPLRQWAIEDRFPLGRPAWAAARRVATSRSLCDAIFAFHDVVPPLAAALVFRDEVTAALEDLATLGVRGALIRSK